MNPPFVFEFPEIGSRHIAVLEMRHYLALRENIIGLAVRHLKHRPGGGEFDEYQRIVRRPVPIDEILDYAQTHHGAIELCSMLIAEENPDLSEREILHLLGDGSIAARIIATSMRVTEGADEKTEATTARPPVAPASAT